MIVVENLGGPTELRCCECEDVGGVVMNKGRPIMIDMLNHTIKMKNVILIYGDDTTKNKGDKWIQTISAGINKNLHRIRESCLYMDLNRKLNVSQHGRVSRREK